MVSVLDRKLLRELVRMWAQVLAVALVLACGVMALVLAVGAYRSLEETRDAYYERYRFGHVFAGIVRAPRHLVPEILAIPGVETAEPRIVKPAVLDIVGMDAPAAGVAISIPSGREPEVNRLFLRSGRLPGRGRFGEIAIDERFARAHSFAIGDRFAAVLGGRKLDLAIVAIILSPEYVYALGPGDLVPDDRRFAVMYMDEAAMSGLFGMDQAFNDISVRLLRGASSAAVMARLDALLLPYGGRGARPRSEQASHAFLDGELTQLYAMARVIPPVFLFVSAFLVNMILSRLVELERMQIGLLKACGYSSFSIAVHYAKLVVVVALLGLGIGSAAGSYLGHALTRLYGDFFSFPFLIFRPNGDLYAIAGAVSVGAALAGAARAIGAVANLPPAVAMRPPSPARFRTLFGGHSRHRYMSGLTAMALRHLAHRPLRAGLTALGIALSVALLVTALFSADSIDRMIDMVFYRAERADARITLAAEASPAAIAEIRRLPGVIAAGSFRVVPAVLRHRHHARRVAITGRADGEALSRVLDLSGRPVAMPRSGLLLTDRLARLLEARPGDLIDVELPESGARIVPVPLAGIVESYIGLGADMEIGALDRLVGGGPRIGGAWIGVDPGMISATAAAKAGLPPGAFLYDAVKAAPGIASVALQLVSRQKFRETVKENIVITMSIYLAIAVIVAFGVLYNAARIQLSESARELASLRILGFTGSETAQVLLTELLVVVAAAQPLGWAIGYGFARSVVAGFESDLFRLPFAIFPATYALASAVVLAAAAATALLVWRRILGLDLMAVLKSGE